MFVKRKKKHVYCTWFLDLDTQNDLLFHLEWPLFSLLAVSHIIDSKKKKREKKTQLHPEL